MEKEVKKVITSAIFKENRRKIYKYGVETFGDVIADIFMERLENILDELEYQYKIHPECKYLSTKGKIYRNIIFGKYLVIYRITSETVEVLTLLHSSRSITKIKTTRSIKI